MEKELFIRSLSSEGIFFCLLQDNRINSMNDTMASFNISNDNIRSGSTIKRYTNTSIILDKINIFTSKGFNGCSRNISSLDSFSSNNMSGNNGCFFVQWLRWVGHQQLLQKHHQLEQKRWQLQHCSKFQQGQVLLQVQPKLRNHLNQLQLLQDYQQLQFLWQGQEGQVFYRTSCNNILHLELPR